ncbi:MAG: PQQ-like beta-propeller repeat protein [Opitutales bacterium]|nr:PQQ-like beta-propeller repeat protein [Opitutales bacterium]
MRITVSIIYFAQFLLAGHPTLAAEDEPSGIEKMELLILYLDEKSPDGGPVHWFSPRISSRIESFEVSLVGVDQNEAVAVFFFQYNLTSRERLALRSAPTSEVGKLLAVNEKGEVVWQIDPVFRPQYMPAKDVILYNDRWLGQLNAVGIEDGALDWQYPPANEYSPEKFPNAPGVYSVPTLRSFVGEDFILTAWYGTLTSLNPSTGKPIWQERYAAEGVEFQENSLQLRKSAPLPDGNVFVRHSTRSSRESSSYFVNAYTGAADSADGFVASERVGDYVFLWVNPEDGSRGGLMVFNSDGALVAGPVQNVSRHQTQPGKEYFVIEDVREQALQVFSLASGERVQTFDSGRLYKWTAGGGLLMSLVGEKGKDNAGRITFSPEGIVAYDIQTGNVLWQRMDIGGFEFKEPSEGTSSKTRSYTRIKAPEILTDHSVFLHGGHVYDLMTGAKLHGSGYWFNEPDLEEGYPTKRVEIVNKHGGFGVKDGRLYRSDPRTGEADWTSEINGESMEITGTSENYVFAQISYFSGKVRLMAFEYSSDDLETK